MTPPPPPSRPSGRWKFAFFLLALFTFRFLFGLVCPPILTGEDEVQTYVIGLKCYTTHTWPYFGPDVQGLDTTFKTQIPGALEGLLIALPLKVLAIPESPILFLNLLSLLAFSFLAWYCCRRLPGLSPWFVYSWVLIAPWSLHYSTQVINPSYAVLGSIVFFIGFLETLEGMGSRVLRPEWANALMGFGFLWVYQLHMSWVLLGPYLAYSLWTQGRRGSWVLPAIAMGGGALPMVMLLVPTLLRYGFTSGHDVHGVLTGINWRNVRMFPDVAGRFLSFASFEVPRFIGLGMAERKAFLLRHWVLGVPGMILWAAGILQPLGMIGIALIRVRSGGERWKTITGVALGTLLLVWASFWFTVKDCRAHTFYITMPIAMVFSFYCWDYLASSKGWRLVAKVFLATALFFQVGYGIAAYRDRQGVYQQERENIRRAIQADDYRLLAERRPQTFY